MTNSTEALQNSETTGSASLGSAASSAIGQLRSGTQSVAVQPPSDKLAQLRPIDTDRRVADALRHISGQPPVFRKRTMFPENGPTYSITEAVSWGCDSDEQRHRALDAVAFALRPAPEATIAQALYELRVITRGRVNRDAQEDEAEAIIWTQNLSRFPADIVLDTLKNWPARPDGQWWPTWHDVLKVVDAATRSRKMLAEHISSGFCLPKPAAAAAADGLPAPDDEAAWARRDAQAAAARERFAAPASPMNKPMTEAEFDSWEMDWRKQVRGQDMRLSPAAMATFTKDRLDQAAVEDPASQFDAWNDQRKGEAA